MKYEKPELEFVDMGKYVLLTGLSDGGELEEDGGSIGDANDIM